MAREDAMGDATEARPEQNPKTPLEDVEMGAADTETGLKDDATPQTTIENLAASPDNISQKTQNNKAQKESVTLPQPMENNATDTDKAPMPENMKPGGPKTEKTQPRHRPEAPGTGNVIGDAARRSSDLVGRKDPRSVQRGGHDGQGRCQRQKTGRTRLSGIQGDAPEAPRD
ncbi:hypothetical protein Cpir12675_000672 [Ceratocystis pirilliformis]|uniref:Uncharacterized protein n=1 Tax=Ceratocystis pirilliformis TaxID=259994 RepID=A0ABR3ZLW0_9PEZI